VARNRTARLAVLGSSVQRAAGSRYTSRSGTAVKRRAVMAVLVLLSLVLITVYFRESKDGGLHDFQSAGATVLRPLQVGAERVVRPFRDAYGWTADLFAAKDDVEVLRAEVERLRQEANQYRTAFEENKTLRELIEFKGPATFPGDFEPVYAAVIGHPPSQFEQQVVIAAGERHGIALNDPVVNEDGLVGRITEVTRDTAQVTLLLDGSAAVSAVDLKTSAKGLVKRGRSGSDILILDQVRKEYEVHPGDEVVTAGSQRGALPSLYPRGIAIGTVTFVGQSDVDPFMRVQVRPAVDFGSLDAVVVLVPKEPR
jgi:rod shape-determining protein MreC